MAASSLPALRVKPREERRVKGGHPWIYSNELLLDPAAKALPPGALVRLFDAHGGGVRGVRCADESPAVSVAWVC